MNERMIGVIAGAIVGAVVMILLIRAFIGRKAIRAEYDERQTLVIGKGYKFGFFAMAACECLLSMASAFDIDIPVTVPVQHFSVIVIGIVVFACYAVWNGAYWGILDENQYKNSVRLLIAIGLVNYISAGVAIAHGELFTDGKIQAPVLNLFCGLMLTVILILTYIRSHVSDDDTEDRS